jgi:hypothetical protein
MQNRRVDRIELKLFKNYTYDRKPIVNDTYDRKPIVNGFDDRSTIIHRIFYVENISKNDGKQFFK